MILYDNFYARFIVYNNLSAKYMQKKNNVQKIPGYVKLLCYSLLQ